MKFLPLLFAPLALFAGDKEAKDKDEEIKAGRAVGVTKPYVLESEKCKGGECFRVVPVARPLVEKKEHGSNANGTMGRN